MLETTKYKTSHVPVTQEVTFEKNKYNWFSIRTTDLKTQELGRTWFNGIYWTTNYKISQLPAAQEAGLELYTNKWC